MKKVEKTRINITMPTHLHEFVKSQANELGIPASTMYLMIVNAYKDNLRIMDSLENVGKNNKYLKDEGNNPNHK